MEEFSAQSNALEQRVRERDAHIQHLNNMLQQQTALQAQSSGTSVPQPDLHREMLAPVKEFDGDDDSVAVGEGALALRWRSISQTLSIVTWVC